MIKEKKILDTSWDFRNVNTKILTHCYHSYPAMMIPQIARRLIDIYGRKSKNLFDPYCGTGTSLVEAKVKNINAIGTDLNPLARLIAKTKTSRIDLQVLEAYFEKFNEFIFSINFGLTKPNIILPTFKNIDFWFSKSVQEKLAIIKQFINNISDNNVRNFFYVSFSETIRDCSFTRNSEFKLYRIPGKQRENFDPDVFGLLTNKLNRNRKGLIDFLKVTKNCDSNVKIFSFNTVCSIDEIADNSIDLIVTSPPYGDSRTTVAYGQFSRFSNQWLGIKNASEIDNKLMGGKTKTINNFNIQVVDDAISNVAEIDPKRAKDVFSFYNDYWKSIVNISKKLKSSAYVCFVVGNRKVKGITLPTDEITKAFFEENGFKHEKTIIRNIPNKRMPIRNSPTNETGKTENTMNKEYIVIMRKE